jgi:S1-C subfamily serine protease
MKTLSNTASLLVYLALAGLRAVAQSDPQAADPHAANQPETLFEKQLREDEAASRAQLQRQQEYQEQLALIKAQADAAAAAQIEVDKERDQAQVNASYRDSVNRAMAEYPDCGSADSALYKAVQERFSSMASDDPLAQNPNRPEIIAHQEAAKLGIKSQSELAQTAGKPPTSSADPVEMGTGFFVTTNGYLLTDFHVIKNATTIQIKDGKGLRTAKLMARDPVNDLAVLKVDGATKCLPLGDCSKVILGENVFTVGFPNPDIQGLSPKLTKGDVSSLAGVQDDPRMYQISAPIQPGNSGGCLVDDQGNVIGIISSKLNAVAMASSTGDVPQNVNYAMKISYAKLLLDGLDDSKNRLSPVNTAPVPFDQSASAVEDSTVLVIAQ